MLNPKHINFSVKDTELILLCLNEASNRLCHLQRAITFTEDKENSNGHPLDYVFFLSLCESLATGWRHLYPNLHCKLRA